MTESSRVAIAVSLPVKVSCSLTNWTRTPAAVEVVEVAGEAVHGVHDDGVALVDEAEHGHQLRPVGVFAGRGVGERAVHGDAVELPVDVLVETADAGVADPLSGDRVPPHTEVSG